MKKYKASKTSVVAAVFGMVIVVVFSGFFVYTAYMNGAPLPFCIMGGLIGVMGIIGGINGIVYTRRRNQVVEDGLNKFLYEDSGESGRKGKDKEPVHDRETEDQGYCPYCGRKLGQDFEYCPKCGKKIPRL